MTEHKRLTLKAIANKGADGMHVAETAIVGDLLASDHVEVIEGTGRIRITDKGVIALKEELDVADALARQYRSIFGDQDRDLRDTLARFAYLLATDEDSSAIWRLYVARIGAEANG